MRSRLLHPATIIATVALFIALGGTSYAVTQLPKNSVGTRELKTNAVTSPKVKNGALLAEDFKSGQLPAGATGPQGPKGDAGADGSVGPQGEPGPSFSFGYSTSLPSPYPAMTADTTVEVVSRSIVIPRTGRLVGTITGKWGLSGAVGTKASAFCGVFMYPPGGGSEQVSRITPTSTAEVVTGPWYVDASMSIAFSYLVTTSGTHSLRVACTRTDISGSAAAEFFGYDLIGVLTEN